MEQELTPTYPYPLRPSELVEGKRFGEEIQPLPLNEKEREEVWVLDREIFSRLEPLRKITPETHTIYPDFFLSKLGWRLARLVYSNPEITEEKLETLAKERAMPFSSENEKKKFSDLVFEELLQMAADEEKFQRYLEDKGISTDQEPSTRQEVEEWFYQLENLGTIPIEIREWVSSLSKDYAMNRFLEESQAHNDRVEK